MVFVNEGAGVLPGHAEAAMGGWVSRHETGWTDQERRAFTERLLCHLDRGTTDVAEEVMTVDTSLYHAPEVAVLEQARVFGALPIVIAHSSQIRQPYDFVTTELVGRPLIVARQKDGSIKALLNACRHRGAPITAERYGRARVWSCPYHGWSYDCNGTLRSITDESKFGDYRGEPGLVEMPVEERHGLIWVVADPTAKIDVSEWLGPMDGVLGAYGLAGYHQFRAGEAEVACNWKVLVDAFVDGYHLKFVHRASAFPHFFNNVQVFDALGRHARFSSPRRSIERLREDATDDLEQHITTGHFLMPNATLLRQPTHFEMLSFRPHRSDPGRSIMSFRLLVPGVPESDRETRRWEKNWSILMEVVRDEDLPLNERLQQSAEAPDAPPLVFGRNEVISQLFHRQLAELLMTRPQPSPEAR